MSWFNRLFRGKKPHQVKADRDNSCAICHKDFRGIHDWGMDCMGRCALRFCHECVQARIGCYACPRCGADLRRCML
jgi:hypothetical protein